MNRVEGAALEGRSLECLPSTQFRKPRKKRIRMIGRGMPISQSKPPRSMIDLLQ
jgi:hypothetical protein